MKRNILSTFRSVCDCWLEYVNNWTSFPSFMDYYNIGDRESIYLLKAVKICKENNARYTELDYIFHSITNSAGRIKNPTDLDSYRLQF